MPVTFYTVAEVAALTKVTRQSVYNWIASGALPAVRVGHAVRITPEALASFIQPAKADDLPDHDKERGSSPRS